jgi:hypothetical protein
VDSDAAPGGVFINYRGMDSGNNGPFLYRELTRHLGAHLVFLDSASIPAGADYVEELLRRVRQAQVVLAVIGPRWLTAADDRGRRLIDNPADWIRCELAEAFAAEVRVIPVLTDGARLPAATDLPADIAALARCQYRPLRHRDAATDLARIVADCTAAVGGNAMGSRPPDHAGTARAGPGHDAAAGKVRRPSGNRARTLWAVLGSVALVAVASVAVFASLGAGSNPQATPTSPPSTTRPTPTLRTGPAPGPTVRTRPTPTSTSSPHTKPPTTPSSSQPSRTTPSPPQPTDSLPPETAASLSEGRGIDLDSGSAGVALILNGVDISIGPGLNGGMVDAGDGAAIYETEQKPTQPADCYENPATTSVPLPLRTGHHLCVLTGNGQIATLNVTASTRSTLKFTYRLWPQTT